jgi:hypothetical protein
LEWQPGAANASDGWCAGAAGESPLHTIAGTGVCCAGYNGKRGRQPKKMNKTIFHPFLLNL